MTVSSIIKVLHTRRPTTAQELLDDCCLPLKLIGQGCFRDVYHIIGTNIVVKVPRRGRQHRKNIRHARKEYAIWNRIKREDIALRPLRKHLPAVLYFDSNTGLIMLRKYRSPSTRYDGKINELSEKVSRLTGTSIPDVHEANVGVDSRGTLKFIDLGCFMGRA